ncbi:MAG TPA: DUF1559 domain-containing protein [Pirellulales bacterium]
MTTSDSESRRGAAWLNALVLVCAIVFLAALWLPRIQGAREAGRRNRCGHQIKELAGAVANGAQTRDGRLPGYLEPLPLDRSIALGDGRITAEARVSWLVAILPMLEQEKLYRHWSSGDALRKKAAADDSVANGYLPSLVCPSSGLSARTPPPCSYAVNTGRQDVRAAAPSYGKAGWPADWRANGVFFNRYIDARDNPAGAPRTEMTYDYLRQGDGSSLTVMLAERLDCGSYAALPPSAGATEAALGVVWWPFNQLAGPPRSRRINGPRDRLAIGNARPASNHPCGVMVAFCDGHSRFISEDIDYGIYCKLLAPNDAACNDPGSLAPVPGDASNSYDRIRHGTLDESMIN